MVFAVRIACALLARERSETTLPKQKPLEKMRKNKGIEAPLQNEKLHPKMKLSRAKIEAKIDQFFNASWGRIFEGRWWILEAKWKQVAIQIA